jgi:hypothetical protein
MKHNIGDYAKEAGAKGTGDCKRRSLAHYKRIGKINADKLKRTFAARFWSKVNKRSTYECWMWTGCTTGHGYGVFGRNYRGERAHRIAFELTHGTIPRNKWVLHDCDTPGCCNPIHLHLGNHAKNTKEAVERKRYKHGKDHHNFGKVGSLNHNTKLTEKIVAKALSELTGKYGDLARACRKFKIPRTTLQRIVDGKTWPHVPRD